MNIPSSPQKVYKNLGWVNWANWLGTENIATQKKITIDYSEAEKFVRNLNLKSVKEWREYIKSGKKPAFLSYNPERTYKNIGWVSYGKFLGSGQIAAKYKKFETFEKAKKIVKKQKLSTLLEYTKWRRLNSNYRLPSRPPIHYKNQGWIDWNDFFGREPVHYGKSIDYEKARKFVQTLKIKNRKEWTDFCKSGKRPLGIPTHPWQAYKKNGWIGFIEFFGINYKFGTFRIWRDFNEAKTFTKKLNLKTRREWELYCLSGKKPSDIPAKPNKCNEYKDKWISYLDWLGLSVSNNYLKIWRNYYEAKKFVNDLNLNSNKEWLMYVKSGKKPSDIPSRPDTCDAYKKEWASWYDWLGTKK